MITLGIDPGLDGALVSYHEAALRVVEIKPYTQAAPGKAMGKIVDWKALVYQIQCTFGDELGILSSISQVFIEQVGARPGQGVVSMFKFGYICGALRGIVETDGCGVSLIHPKTWKAHYGLGADKAEAYDLACDIFSAQRHLFATPRGRIKDGIVDATLIAQYGHDFLMEKRNDS